MRYVSFILACTILHVLPYAALAAGGAPLPLADAVTRALELRPELKAFAFTLRQQDAQAAAAALRPPSRVELLVEDIAGVGTRPGVSSAQTTLSLGTVLELGGKREARVAVAGAGRDLLLGERSALQLDIVADVARRYVAVLEAQHHLAIATQGVALADTARQLAAKRVAAASAPPAEGARATVQLTEARLLQEDAEHELETARHALAAAMGRPDPDFGAASADLLALPPVEPFDALRARLDATPELLRFASEERLRDSELRLAQRRARADVTLNLGLRRYEQNDGFGLVAGFSLPLGAAAQAAPQAEAGRAARERVGAEREARWLALQSRLFTAHQQLEHARHVADTLRADVIPQLETALAQTGQAYERGRYAWLELAAAQRDLLAARRRLVQSAADFHVLRVEIERLTATGLDAAGAPP